MIKTIDLNGDWLLCESGESATWPARVPGCVQTDLLRNGQIPDPFVGTNENEVRWVAEKDWVYTRTFSLSAADLEEAVVELVCEGLDTVAAVYVNSQGVLESDNMFLGHRVDIRNAVRAGENELRIVFRSILEVARERGPQPLDVMGSEFGAGREYVRTAQCSFGWDWGPALFNTGIYRPIRLELRSRNRIDSVLIEQDVDPACVTLKLSPELAEEDASAQYRVELFFENECAAQIEAAGAAFELDVKDPQLWWCNGLGEQPLYQLRVSLLDGEAPVDVWERRIALCDVKLEQKPDQWGASFQFVVNGVPVFAKGSNWIPANPFYSEVTTEQYRELIGSARASNMNMVRNWGGGLYEDDAFYDACAENGIIVWQDFMFANAYYPTDELYHSIQREAAYQVTRLRHHAHIGLWCGNNEMEYMAYCMVGKDDERVKNYDTLFNHLLPDAVEEFSPGMAYIPGSAFNPEGFDLGDPNNPESGDAHYWDNVMYGTPIENVSKLETRFLSEFGMQAYPHPSMLNGFVSDLNITGPEMMHRQKRGEATRVNYNYMMQLHRMPKDYAATAYLSQLVQAFYVRMVVEHTRRSMPQTMGALYWQMNDFWPAISWSGMEFDGRWRALQYEARRFFAPCSVSAKWLGEEQMLVTSNTIVSTVHGAELWTVYDAGLPAGEGILDWILFRVDDGSVQLEGQTAVELEPGVSCCQLKRDFTDIFDSSDRSRFVLRTRLSAVGQPQSEHSLYFCAPKQMEFKQAGICSEISQTSDCTARVVISAGHVSPKVMLDFDDCGRFTLSDNFIDLWPNEPREIDVVFEQPISLKQAESALRVFSYAESYELKRNEYDELEKKYDPGGFDRPRYECAKPVGVKSSVC
ncbi:hypothetical protein PDESU_02482 [Pontiella desulfatans]|uniref:Beta-mannosidase B n=1 Tax=Pontiella desulfatans TaxID=2750659 RepID=A0A6C2U214_PONDE|nr:glycoside hydrolase family 2 protein [Pontiella desulfatans]VGO13925.1 hypothetical protein PDESU_02482 [Pontiella desulfatans]